MSRGIKSVTEASKLKSKCETKTHRNFPARSENVKKVDNSLTSLNKRNRVDSSLSVKRTGFISNSISVCNICNECLVFGNHKKCGVKNLNSMNAKNPKVKNDAIVKQVWKATGKIFASVGSNISTSEPANNVIVTPRFSKKPLTSYKRKDRKLKDISTGSPPNIETKAVNDRVNVNDLSANQLDPNKNWVSDVLNSTASSVFQCSDDEEDEEPTPQPKTKPVKETPLPKPYKPKIPYPQRLRKEKMEAQYRKFLDMIRAVRNA
ncbi:hypothetical protein Tco_0705432 [Tanacetum coccineum]|uniref:Uncharacterized protein n=1 Tax=Tanacetum coccineum TaxID=301880 RepID=A0ABQ4Y5H3_9ASTR